ncbi:hypothetical protein MB46_06620 [Arthrobacter alpinus]|uniref:hypothetical protein n=1 Tax=Arthrobacter alpinus TaxID=656366 RepID=UPI0005CADA44|nr:hypothetical protein [Arthrobacter alpinus]ALV45223.1 hypothetical protein MB46_06620 [Arthrobacter alpinus]
MVGHRCTYPGGVTGFGEAWLNPGRRGARATDVVDPWVSIGVATTTEPTPTTTGLGGIVGAGVICGGGGSRPDGVGLSATGGLSIAGLDWLGAGWDGNPYP